MLHGYFDKYAASRVLIPAAWSLTIEESFYLLLPFLCLLLGLASRGKGGAVRPLPFLLALVALNAALVGAGFGLGTRLPATRAVLPDWLNMTVFGQIPTFSVGILAGVFVARRPDSFVLRSPAWGNALGAAAVGLFALGAWYFGPGESWMEGFRGQAFFAPSSALMLLALCGRSVFARLLGNPLITYGGRISYAFYLIHVHPACRHFITWIHLSNPFLVYLLYSGFAAALYQLVEKPAHRYLRRRWAGAA
jgi:peptidoglycan/LPS O-acetylase OafA/YrhL